MPLLGRAVVAIWSSIVPQMRAEFIDWHNREHMPERMGIPGFLRGRRYLTHFGLEDYFTLYEADALATLTGDEYSERLGRPTEWTRKMTAGFRDSTRMVGEVVGSVGDSVGGFMLTARLAAPDGFLTSIREQLSSKALPAANAAPGVVAAHLCVRAAQGSDGTAPRFAILIEASNGRAAQSAFLKVRSMLTRSGQSAPEFEIGLHALEMELTRQ